MPQRRAARSIPLNRQRGTDEPAGQKGERMFPTDTEQMKAVLTEAASQELGGLIASLQASELMLKVISDEAERRGRHNDGEDSFEYGVLAQTAMAADEAVAMVRNVANSYLGMETLNDGGT